MSAETPQVVRVPSSKDIETGSGEDVGQSPAEETGPNKFRVMGLIAQAVKRFQANMNPTYTYGKRRHGRTHDQPPAVRRQSSCSTALDNQEGKKPSKIPGKRTSIIFAPLPPPEVAQPDRFPELLEQQAKAVAAS